jgi:hypothetical protein|tara:strand:- start:21817 stop:22476 length:660 start_codon:yes stop_codon:yes gene_type:complete
MLIGLVGFIGSGKDTVANMFVQKGCQQDSFASPLKDVCSSIFGWERSLLTGDTIESRDFRETPDMYWTKKLGIANFTPRLALQLMGTEVMRNHFNEDIWLSSLEYRIMKQHAAAPCTVISDARFINELDLIKRMGGKIIWVQRGELPDWFETATTASSNVVKRRIMETTYKDVHESEWNWAGYPSDYVINNNGTLDDLQTQVDSIRDWETGEFRELKSI